MSQVSWLRWSDMSVLTVGGLVFSSDPRLLVTMTQLSPSTVSWKLYISRCEGSWWHETWTIVSLYDSEWPTLMRGITSVRLTQNPSRALMSPLLSLVHGVVFRGSMFYSMFSRQHYEGSCPSGGRWWRNVQCFQCWQFWQQSETKTRQIIFSISQRNCV